MLLAMLRFHQDRQLRDLLVCLVISLQVGKMEKKEKRKGEASFRLTYEKGRVSASTTARRRGV